MSTTHANPYHPVEDTECYRAYRKGREAWDNGRPIATLPYPLSQSREALAWLDGWRTQSRASVERGTQVV